MVASAASQHCQNLPLPLTWQGDWRDREMEPSGARLESVMTGINSIYPQTRMLKSWRVNVPKRSPFKMNKDTKVKIHRFWIPESNTLGVSRDRLFVAKADYDRAIKRIRQERELADKLAVELSACNNTWIFNENEYVVATLNQWREARK
jgi:hypothetical protein